MTSSPDLKAWLRAEGFGEDLEAVVANATTPLMRAALKGDVEMAKALLAAGANIAARNGDGNNALWLACVARTRKSTWMSSRNEPPRFIALRGFPEESNGLMPPGRPVVSPLV